MSRPGPRQLEDGGARRPPRAHPRRRPSRLRQLGAVMRKEVLQTVRDKRMLALLLVAPTVQLFVFGFVVDLEVDQVPTIVVDRDATGESWDHLAELAADGTLRVDETVRDLSGAEEKLIRGQTAVVILLENGFTRDLGRGEPARVQALVDGSDPNRSTVAVDTVSRFFQHRAREHAEGRALFDGSDELVGSPPSTPAPART